MTHKSRISNCKLAALTVTIST